MPNRTRRIILLGVGLVVALGALAFVQFREDPDEAFRRELEERSSCATDVGGELTGSESFSTANDDLELVQVADDLGLVTSITSNPVTGRLLVTERSGRALELDPETGEQEVMVDLTGQVSRDGDEDGMLGGAYAADGAYAYLHYTDPDLVSRVEAYPIDGEQWGDPILLESLQQPHRWRNGGQIVVDGDTMWLAMGDGGPMSDPNHEGQNPESLFGTLLRYDLVDEGAGLEPADDNPFTGEEDGGADEVWAYGLRNPWRFWVDEEHERLVIADVGDFCFEEINVIGLDQAGANFGWRVVEGRMVHEPSEVRPEFVEPRYTYAHGPDGCAVIGGSAAPVENYPSLGGDYLMADFCGGEILTLDLDGSGPPQPTGVGVSGLSTFGLGLDGTIYVGSAGDGLLRLTAVG